MSNVPAIYQATTLNLGQIDCKKFFNQFLYRAVELEQQPEVIRLAIADIDTWMTQNMPMAFGFAKSLTPFRVQQLRGVILAMVAYYQSKEIEKARYGELKDVGNHVVSNITDIFSKVMLQLHDDKRQQLGPDYVQEKINTYSLGSMHEIKADLNKLNKYIDRPDDLTAFEAALIESRLALMNELNHLYLANEDLKTRTVATRRTTSTAKVLDQGEHMTCGYCLRSIRLQNKKSNVIAYHGFTRDDSGYGMISGNSCTGSNFKPLEKSPEASLMFIKHSNNSKKSALEDIQKLEKKIAELESKAGKNIDEYKELRKLQSALRSCQYFVETVIPRDQRMMIEKLKQYHPAVVVEAEGYITC